VTVRKHYLLVQPFCDQVNRFYLVTYAKMRCEEIGPTVSFARSVPAKFDRSSRSVRLSLHIRPYEQNDRYDLYTILAILRSNRSSCFSRMHSPRVDSNPLCPTLIRPNQSIRSRRITYGPLEKSTRNVFYHRPLSRPIDGRIGSPISVVRHGTQALPYRPTLMRPSQSILSRPNTYGP